MRPKNFVPMMEPGGRDSIVDKLGYVTAEKRIKQMMQAGIRFAAAGADVFDGFIEDGDLVVPPWREKDFDIADGAQYLRAAVKRKQEIEHKLAMARDPRTSGLDNVPAPGNPASGSPEASASGGVQGQSPAANASA